MTIAAREIGDWRREPSATSRVERHILENLRKQPSLRARESIFAPSGKSFKHPVLALDKA
jgi:hypothetical protein